MIPQKKGYAYAAFVSIHIHATELETGYGTARHSANASKISHGKQQKQQKQQKCLHFLTRRCMFAQDPPRRSTNELRRAGVQSSLDSIKCALLLLFAGCLRDILNATNLDAASIG